MVSKRKMLEGDPHQALFRQELLELQEHNASIQESTEHLKENKKNFILAIGDLNSSHSKVKGEYTVRQKMDVAVYDTA